MRTRRAFTLAESMLASVVVATSVVSIAAALAAATQNQAALRDQCVMLQLGRSLAEEIACVQFTQPDGAIGGGFGTGNTNRAEYNDVFDYDGYTDQSPFAALSNDPQAVNDAPGYSRRVTVEMHTNPQTTAASLGAAQFARVLIEVKAPGGKTLKLERWVPRIDLQK